MNLSEEDKLFEKLKTHHNICVFDKIYRRWYPSLVAFAAHYVDMENARDIVQDTMTYLWENATKIEIKGSLGAYLHTAVRNRCLTHISQSNRHENILSSMRISLIEETQNTDICITSEMDMRLRNAIYSLPTTQKQAFEMNRFEKKRYADIAQETGVSQKTVEYRISQAIRKLRKAMEEFL